MDVAQLNYLDCSRKVVILQQIKPILDRYEINRTDCFGPTLTITGIRKYASFSVDFFTGAVTIDSNDLFTDAEAEEIRQEIAKYVTADPHMAMGLLGGGRKKRSLRKHRRRSTLRKQSRKQRKH